MHMMRGGPHRTRALEFEILHWTVVRNLIFVGWHNSEVFAVLSKDQHQRYVSLTAFSKNIEALRMLCVPLTPMFSYHSSVFGDKATLFGHWLLKIAMKEFMILSTVHFIQAAEYCAADLFLPACLRALAEVGRLCANEDVLVPGPNEMRVEVRRRGLLRAISDCMVDPVSAILVFASAGEVD